MAQWTIILSGCDDSTHIDMELTEEQAELVRTIATKSEQVSTYNCMPVMRIELHGEAK